MKLKFAVIGDGTRKKLAEKGIYADYMPSIYDGKHLGYEISKNANTEDKILIARAKIGNDDILNELKAFDVTDVPIYDTEPNKNDFIDIRAKLNSGDFDYIIFTSSSSVRFFVESNSNVDYSKLNAVCIGDKTGKTAAEHGMKCFVSKEASVDGIVNLIQELNNDRT